MNNFVYFSGLGANNPRPENDFESDPNRWPPFAGFIIAVAISGVLWAMIYAIIYFTNQYVH